MVVVLGSIKACIFLIYYSYRAAASLRYFDAGNMESGAVRLLMVPDAFLRMKLSSVLPPRAYSVANYLCQRTVGADTFGSYRVI